MLAVSTQTAQTQRASEATRWGQIAAMAKRLDRAPAALHEWIERYEAECSQPRQRYLWGWVLRGLDKTCLPGVDAAHAGAVGEAKFLGVMLTVVLDDLADGGADPAWVVQLCTDVLGGPESRHAFGREARLGADLYAAVISRLEPMPRFGLLRPFLEYDYAQLANGMRYAALVNRWPAAGNGRENAAYLCHNMHMVTSGTMDLMARRNFNEAEFGDLREVLYLGQRMGRLGNALSTWQREVGEDDFTSEFFPNLAARTRIPVEELAQRDVDTLTRLATESGTIAGMFAEWDELRAAVHTAGLRIQSVPIGDYVHGLGELLSMHLDSVGLK